jgi:hypothetical protein
MSQYHRRIADLAAGLPMEKSTRRILDTGSTAMSSMVRVTVMVLVIGGLGAVGMWRWSFNEQEKLRTRLAAVEAEMAQKLAERQAMIDRLSRTRRIGHLEIPTQKINAAGAVESSDVLFVELDDAGHELGRQTFTVPGDTVYVDAWTVKFDSERVAEGHPLRGKTLILLRRIYSEQTAPSQGAAIDTPGAIPTGYAASDGARYEQSLWRKFWEIASDPQLAKEMGVRVAQGEAVYQKVKMGQTFKLTVDSLGGMNMEPLGEVASAKPQ